MYSRSSPDYRLRLSAAKSVTSDKSLIYGKVLVEDWPPYVEKWLKWRKRGLEVLMDRPYNRGFKHPNVVRSNHSSFDEVFARMQEAFER